MFQKLFGKKKVIHVDTPRVPRRWEITGRDNIERILSLIDEHEKHPSHTNHYKLWNAVIDVIPECDGVTCKFDMNGHRLYIVEIL